MDHGIKMATLILPVSRSGEAIYAKQRRGKKEPPKFDRCTYGKKSKEKEEKSMVYYFTNAVKKTNSGMCVWTLSAVKFKDKYHKCMSRFGDFKSKSNGYQLLTQKHCLSKLG